MLIKASPDNVYVGCKVVKGKTTYYVYKINSTTLWGGLAETDEVLTPVKKKYVKFSEKMKQIDAKKISYTELMVDEEDAKKVRAKSDKRFLKDCCELSIRAWHKKINTKTGAYKNMFECKSCETQISPVKVEDGKVLFSVDYQMFWYDFSTRQYTFFRKI
jgi:hypothetical protein